MSTVRARSASRSTCGVSPEEHHRLADSNVPKTPGFQANLEREKKKWAAPDHRGGFTSANVTVQHYRHRSCAALPELVIS
jgi:hypothetical protein